MIPPLCRSLQAGHITFASFNDLAKATPRVMEAWVVILPSLPQSRLLLKADSLAAPALRQVVQDFLSEQGIAPDRVTLLGRGPSTRHLEHYQQVDIALDTFPYNGTTTTCEALWMGVPVISLAGDRHASRVGLSLLSTVGLPDLAATTQDDHTRLALRLAGDLPRLTDLRSTLRPRLQSSALTDALRFTRHVEQTYRQMWRTFCSA